MLPFVPGRCASSSDSPTTKPSDAVAPDGFVVGRPLHEADHTLFSLVCTRSPLEGSGWFVQPFCRHPLSRLGGRVVSTMTDTLPCHLEATVASKPRIR